MNKPIIIQQHSRADCGATCLLSLVKFYGGRAALENIRVLSGTTKNGVTLLGLYQAAIKMGFDAKGCESDIVSLISHNKPTILHTIQNDKYEHFIIFYKYSDCMFTIGDPTIGIKQYTRVELEKIWVSGLCLTLEPNKNFERITRKEECWFRRVIEIVKPDLPNLYVALFFGLLISILSLSLAFFSQYLIDNILQQGNSSKLVLASIVLGILLLFKISISSIRQYILTKQAKDFNVRSMSRFFSKIIYLPKYFFDSRQTGDIVARLHDARRIQGVVSHIFSSVLVDILIFTTSLIALFYFSTTIGLIFTLATPVMFFLIHSKNKKIVIAQKELMVGYALSESSFIQSIKNITLVKSSCNEDELIQQNISIFKNFQNKVKDLGVIKISLSFQVGVFSTFLSIIIIIIGAFQVLNSSLLIGQFIAIVTISSSIMPTLSSLAVLSIPINEAKVAQYRIEELSELNPEDNTGAITVESINELSINGLSFSFPSSSVLLNNISLNLKRGGIYGLIGECGSGKSTLCQILLKFYEPLKGDIFINKSIPLKKTETKHWRKLIGYVPQEISLIDGTVLENIYINASGESYNIENSIKRLIGYKVFEKFFKELPQGLSTIIGEGGINLSGGQKQILGLARSLVFNPQLLILDETTSSLDSNNELLVFELLNSISNNKLILFCTHHKDRLSCITKNIFEFRNNSIVAAH